MQSNLTGPLSARFVTSAARKHCFRLSLNWPRKLSCVWTSLLNRFDTSKSTSLSYAGVLTVTAIMNFAGTNSFTANNNEQPMASDAQLTANDI